MIRRTVFLPVIMLLIASFCNLTACAQGKNIKLVFIRHAEKPAEGDNLSCAGLNRALKLAEVLKNKFGIPDRIYVPALHLGKSTPRSRMFQTISPFAIKYNLTINSKFEEEDAEDMASELQGKKGTSIIVWEHNEIKSILKELGLSTKKLTWDDNDFDTIWIVTYRNGKPELAISKEGITPAAGCSF